MSNMTTRLSDSQLAEIAKQKYDSERKSKIPGIIINLPSQGLVYPKTSILRQGSLEMRYMTAYDEDILTNKNYINNNIVFEKLLESVITTPGFNSRELIDADKSWLILMIRITSYDSNYNVTVKTPDNQNIAATIDLNKITFTPFSLTSDDNGEFEYIVNDETTIKYKYISSAVLSNIPNDNAVSYLLSNSITQVNQTRDKNKILDWIKYDFLRKDSSAFRKHLSSTAPDIDISYRFDYTTKEGKQESFQAGFPIGSDFFWL